MSQKTVKIAGALFTLTAPYAEGHPLTAAEAKALNQVRAENIGNNARKKIEEMKGEGDWTDATLQTAAEHVASIDASYVFNLTNIGGGKKSADPVEAEAMKIAKERVAAALKNAGKTLKDVDKDKLAAKVAEVAAREDVMKLARKRVEERAKAAGDINLDDI